jgi:hypothetical protein
MSLLRSWRGWRFPHHGEKPAETSPLLIYVAVVLAFLLAMLEADRHQQELESLGLLRNDSAAQSVFLGP